MKNWWTDFVALKQYITPTLMPIVFWVGAGIAVLMGILTIIEGATGQFIAGATRARMVISGLITMIAGPVFVRILCEIVMTFFRRED